jgi:hypothetical protein
MQNKSRWTFLLTLVVAALVAAPMAVQADLAGLQPLQVKQGARGQAGEGQGDSGGTPELLYSRSFAPVIERLAPRTRRVNVGPEVVLTPGGPLSVAGVEGSLPHFRRAADVSLVPAGGTILVHYGTMSSERVALALDQLGDDVTIFAPMPNNAFVATFGSEFAVPALQRAGFTVLGWTAGFFTDPGIGQTQVVSQLAAANPILTMSAALFEGADVEAMTSRLAGIGGTIKAVSGSTIVFSIDIGTLRDNLEVLDYAPIGSLAEMGTMISADEEGITTTTIGEFRNGDRPFDDAGVNGSSQIVAVTDTGLSLDAAVLADSGGGGPTPADSIGAAVEAAGASHRKVLAYVTAQSVPGGSGSGDLLTCDGTTGVTHGHVVASLIAGNAEDVVPDIQALSGFETAISGSVTNYAIDGVAANARVYFIDAQDAAQCNSAEQIEAQDPGLLSAGLLAGQTAGARIHNLSISEVGSEATYTANSKDVDTFLHDNQNYMVVAAAGNRGADGNADGNLDFLSVTSPCTAKNALCVSAAGVDNNELDPENSTFPNVPNNGPEMLSRFQGGRASGQGPASVLAQTDANLGDDYVIKPDVTAPGSETLDNQRMTSPSTCVSNDNDNTGVVQCARMLPGALAGSSFAAANASGAAALVRDYFSKGYHPNGEAGASAGVAITGPELKAAMIASADLMTGNPQWRQLGGQLQLAFYSPKHLSTFTPEQGYGRIQLNKLLPLNNEPTTPPYIHRESINLAEGVWPAAGAAVDRTFTVIDAASPFRCAAAWYDLEGTPVGGDVDPIRDVDMTVTDCGLNASCGDGDDGATYNGNFFTEDRNFDGSLTDLPATFVCEQDTGISCTTPAVDPAECDGAGAGTGDCVLDTPAITEDCNSSGELDFSEFSLPVPGAINCNFDARDRHNSNEAVFVHEDDVAQGTTYRVRLQWVSSDEGVAAPSTIPVGLVCTGGVRHGTTPNTVRLNSEEYSCSDAVVITVVDQASNATPAGLSSAITLVSKNAGGVIQDTESGWAYTDIDGIAGGTKFESQVVATLDGTSGAPANNNQIVSVYNGGTLEVTYTDGPDVATAKAQVRCSPAVNIANIARRGTNTNFTLTGGCDPRPRFDPRIIVFGLVPGTGGNITGDLFLDQGEDLVYSVAINNTELGDSLLDVTATLTACDAGDVTPAGVCLDEADGITIINPSQSLGTIPQGKGQIASFSLRVSSAVSFPSQIQMIFGVNASRNGFTQESRSVFHHVLHTDTWSRANEAPATSGASYYSTDFPTGGTEIRNYAGEFWVPGDNDLAAEEFVFQNAITGGSGRNANLGAFDALCTKYPAAASCTASLGSNNWPWNFDSSTTNTESFGVRRRFDSDPGANTELAAANVWQYNNTGECGFQSNFSGQADGQGGVGGMWHTGSALSAPPPGPPRTGYDLGCEDYDLPGSPDPKREQVLDVLSSPQFFRVNTAADGNGFQYQLEFLRLGYNYQVDIADGNTIMAGELDPDTTTPSPVDPLDFGWLASDQGADGYLSLVSQGPYKVFNPNDPYETTSALFVGLGPLDTTAPGQNIAPVPGQAGVHGAGSAGSYFDPNDPAKAPARPYGEIPGVFGTGRGIGLPAERGAGGFPVRSYDAGLNEVGAGTFEDTFGPNETRSPLQTYPITAGNPEVLSNRRDTFQVNLIAFLRESPDSGNPADPSYGYGIDDVVVEWREQRPVADRTPCSNPSTWATDTDGNPIGGASADPSKAGGCASISWDRTNILDPEATLILTVIDSNAAYGPDGIAEGEVACPYNGNVPDLDSDDQATDEDCDGLDEVSVSVNAAPVDTLGEVFRLEQIAPLSSVYAAAVQVSSTTGLTSNTDGVIFIQENGDGTSPVGVQATYTDNDINVNGTHGDNVPCPDNPRQATVNTQFVGGDVLFVTAIVNDCGPNNICSDFDDPANNDGDRIADDKETVEFEIVMVNSILDLNRQQVTLEDVVVTLVTTDSDVKCVLNGSSSFGQMDPGIAKSNDGPNYKVVIDNIGRLSTAQVLQAEFTLGINAHYTDSDGVERIISAFATPQRFAVNLDLDISGGASPLAEDSACVGGTSAGRACDDPGDCPGGTCTALPAYLASGGSSPIQGAVGYFEGFEGGTANVYNANGAVLAGTSFEHKPAVRAAPFGYLRGSIAAAPGEGLTPGSTTAVADIPEGSSIFDGTRCNYNDPKGFIKHPRSEGSCSPGPISDWHINGLKAFSGTKSLYAGVEGPAAGFPDNTFDGNRTKIHQAAFSGILNIGVAGGATLSLQHIVQATDDRTFNVPDGQAAGRSWLEIAEVDGSGVPTSGWFRLAGFQNNYGNTAVQPFFVNCIFQNYDAFYDAAAALGGTPGFNPGALSGVGVDYNADDVSSEDDFFDPNDPVRQLGPSDACFPNFVYSSLGDYTSTNPADKGKAFTDGFLGSNGTGVWVNSLFNLDTFAGRRVRIRYLFSDIDISGTALWAQLFGNTLGNAFRGAILDDFAVSGLTANPLTLLVDSRATPGTDDCPATPAANCNTITANAGPDEVTLVSGATVVLDASASSADSCVDGFLQFRWRIGDDVVQDYSTQATLVDAPTFVTPYTVDVRCSTDLACADSDLVVVIPKDQAEASALGCTTPDSALCNGEFIEHDSSGDIVAYGPPTGSLGGPWSVDLLRVEVQHDIAAAPWSTGGATVPDSLRGQGSPLASTLQANLCELAAGVAIVGGSTALAPYTDGVTVLLAPVAATPAHQGVAGARVGEVVGYLAKANTTGLLTNFPGTLGQNNAVGTGGLGGRGTVTTGGAARGSCATNP